MSMAKRVRGDQQPTLLAVLGATIVGLIAVVVSLVAFNLMVGGEATEQAVLSRVASYMYWTQPFIYIMAGLIAGAPDSRWGPVRAPVVGLFLASMCWLMLTRQNLLPSEPNIVAYLLPAGAIFGLIGAMIAPLLKEYVRTAVGGIIVLGVVAFLWSLLNLGSISGPVQREIIERAAGMTTAMRTVGVPQADVALLDPDTEQVLYVTSTNQFGYYRIGRAPIGEYVLRVNDPEGPAVITQNVELERSITGGTRWQTVSLPRQVRDAGPLFR